MHTSPTPANIAALLVATAAVLSVLCPSAATATDYERNDVNGRELGVVVMRTPVAGQPLSMLVSGTARRHTRFFYVGGNLSLGVSLQGQPVTMLSGAVGLETADDGFVRVRGYGELGAGAFWANSDQPVLDLLMFHVETGVRWQMRSWARPHWQLVAGVRLFSNFRYLGFAVLTGMNFTFD